MSKDKYKHAMEVIVAMNEGKTIQENNGPGIWKDDPNPEAWSVENLNDPELIRIKREPRRVWVNYSESGFPMAYESQEVAMCKRDYSEKAVEFVEVVK